MKTAPAFNPTKHPRRAALVRDHQIAEHARALAPSLTAKAAAPRFGISSCDLEQLAARHGFAFVEPRKC